MSELFELERMGLDIEAEERSAYYAALFDGQPLGEIFNLRRLAYREIREGPEAVRDKYRSIVDDENTFPDVAEQARLLLWRTEEPYRALFGGIGHSEFRLFVNGQPVGNGDGRDPFTYRAFPLQLEPGSHLLQAEVVSRGENSWYSFGFFSDFTNVVSDVSWDVADTRPDRWPETDGPASLWQAYPRMAGFFPTMPWWRFTPNAFPMTQSGQQKCRPSQDWEKNAGQTVYLRRIIHVPDQPSVRHNPFQREYLLRRTPVRPESDTSNAGLTRP